MKTSLVFTLLLTVELLLCGSALAGGGDAQLLALENAVLQQDTDWSGTVEIKGVVVVGRNASLTIAPGTKILFRKTDRNNDGIGDGEIRVLGKLSAVGTKKQPIIFTSAEKIPQINDWSYVLLFASSQTNTIRHCRFEHAFSGLQVHFSTAEVTDNTFNSNHEGIRFGRAKLTFAHNLVSGNTLGVRFTRMEGPVEIHHNEITANDVGIFLVPSGQNIIDFFEPGRTGKPWNEGHLAIYSNNIYRNTDYNLKLGAKQVWDLQISNNWWGGLHPAALRESIFDINRDPELGKALLEPIAAGKISTAGIRPL